MIRAIPRSLSLAAGVFLLAAGSISPTLADDEPPPYQLGPPLVEPLELCADGDGVLDVRMRVGVAQWMVDVVDDETHEIRRVPKTLRSYHLDPKSRAEICGGSWGRRESPMMPGPTFRLRKSAAGTIDGDRFRLHLTNDLPHGLPHWECNPIQDMKPEKPVHPVDGECNKAAFPDVPQTWPACFHGDQVTNFHYHGFHISPQSPQDDVLLEIEPAGGSFQYELDPVPYTQAEGTHWYHPHKHGSTALQVLNGMAGTFVIEGPFDDWLNAFFLRQEAPLDEKVLVVQQIDEVTEFFKRIGRANAYRVYPDGRWVENEDGDKVPCGADDPDESCGCFLEPDYNPPTPAVNGRVNPVITMRPGEIQRWRFVGATMQASGHLDLGVSKEFRLLQIAQDGVPFAVETYHRQPLLDPRRVELENDREIYNFYLAPGNRADFLIQAPADAAPGDLYFVTHDVIGHVAEDVRQRLDERDAAALAHGGVHHLEDPPLLTVRIEGEPVRTRFPHHDAAGRWRADGEYAREWPPLPPYLHDLGEPSRRRDVSFDMKKSPGEVRNAFYINDVQYCPECANITMELGTIEEWRLVNPSSPNHPFHIHVNPFQVRKIFGLYSPKPGTTVTPIYAEYDPPVWQDTLALPGPGCVEVARERGDRRSCEEICTYWEARVATEHDDCDEKAATGSCLCHTPEEGGYAEIRQKLRDFTGEYVIHCHILGHEDRGMMLNVQTVCPGEDAYGPASPGVEECRPGGPRIDAAPKCPPSYATGPGCAETEEDETGEDETGDAGQHEGGGAVP